MPAAPRIGLALSGGGSRAIAFHLGCFRALNDYGLLERISVLSTVSGGSIVGALWAYSDYYFSEFEQRVKQLLASGFTWGIARQTLLSPETPRILAALVTAGVPAAAGMVGRLGIGAAGVIGIQEPRLRALAEAISAPVPRFASRTTAFVRHLRQSVLGDLLLDEVAREGLSVVINATELRTGTAFRYGSAETGSWRYGRTTATRSVAEAVGASAAFPALLPAIDQIMEFEREGRRERKRVIVTDGGVYDNLGVSCLLPGRSAEFSTNVHPVEVIIACVAGTGQSAGTARPFLWPGRMLASIDTTHRRTHSQHFDLLHRMRASGEISGFVLPYLGQIDQKLPRRPPDLVPREAVQDYPTDFSPMSQTNMDLLAGRGEQLTRLLLEEYGVGL